MDVADADPLSRALQPVRVPTAMVCRDSERSHASSFGGAALPAVGHTQHRKQVCRAKHHLQTICAALNPQSTLCNGLGRKHSRVCGLTALKTLCVCFVRTRSSYMQQQCAPGVRCGSTQLLNLLLDGVAFVLKGVCIGLEGTPARSVRCAEREPGSSRSRYGVYGAFKCIKCKSTAVLIAMTVVRCPPQAFLVVSRQLLDDVHAVG